MFRSLSKLFNRFSNQTKKTKDPSDYELQKTNSTEKTEQESQNSEKPVVLEDNSVSQKHEEEQQSQKVDTSSQPRIAIERQPIVLSVPTQIGEDMCHDNSSIQIKWQPYTTHTSMIRLKNYRRKVVTENPVVGNVFAIRSENYDDCSSVKSYWVTNVEQSKTGNPKVCHGILIVKVDSQNKKCRVDTRKMVSLRLKPNGEWYDIDGDGVFFGIIQEPR